MSLSAEQIEQNWQVHLKLVDHYITERKQSILDFLEKVSEEYIMAPASPKLWHHNAFPGGYVDHVNRVVRFAFKQSQLYAELGGTVNYSDEELVFSALFHDLGKIGDGERPNYIPQTDSWRRDKLSEAYSFNSELDFMTVSDRSLYILQKYGIPVSQTEYISIKTHDGMFEEANKPYYVSYSPESKFKSNLPYIIHTADFLASKVEYDIWVSSDTSNKPSKKGGKRSTKGTASKLPDIKGTQGLSDIITAI